MALTGLSTPYEPSDNHAVIQTSYDILK